MWKFLSDCWYVLTTPFRYLFALQYAISEQRRGEQTYCVIDDSTDCLFSSVDVASFPGLFVWSNYGSALFVSPEVDAKEAQRVFRSGVKHYLGRHENVTFTPNFKEDFSRWAFRRKYDEEGRQRRMQRPYLQEQQAKQWLDKGGDVNTVVREGLMGFRDRRGWSLLMLSVLHGELPTVDLLLDRGADVNIVSTNGLTALTIAKGVKNPYIIHRLQRAGAIEMKELDDDTQFRGFEWRGG